jgi:molybdopterin converting factor small subunit
MATVQEDILKAFYAKLAKSKEFDKTMIDAVRTLVGTDKKLKADDLVAVLLKNKQEGGL